MLFRLCHSGQSVAQCSRRVWSECLLYKLMAHEPM